MAADVTDQRTGSGSFGQQADAGVTTGQVLVQVAEVRAQVLQEGVTIEQVDRSSTSGRLMTTARIIGTRPNRNRNSNMRRRRGHGRTIAFRRLVRNFHPPRPTVPMPLTILYRDDHCVGRRQAARAAGPPQPDLARQGFALQLLRVARPRAYPVHRLDRATSGVLLFALMRHHLRKRMVARFDARLVGKEYLAVARGTGRQRGLSITRSPTRMPVRPPQPAQTLSIAADADRAAVLRSTATRPAASLMLTVTPLTGRRQQIRKRFKNISHHLIGDTTHGSSRSNLVSRGTASACARLLLMSPGAGVLPVPTRSRCWWRSPRQKPGRGLGTHRRPVRTMAALRDRG